MDGGALGVLLVVVGVGVVSVLLAVTVELLSVLAVAAEEDWSGCCFCCCCCEAVLALKVLVECCCDTVALGIVVGCAACERLLLM